jgi:hypothetical protein
VKARQTVATAAVVSATVIVLAELGSSGGLPPANQLIGYAVVFTFLSVLADFNLEFAGGLAVIAMVAIILERGDDAFKFVGERGGFQPE